jgi:hypothetical protein
MYQGNSILPLLDNEETSWRDSFFIEHLYDIEFIPKSEGVRNKNWKYFRYIDHPEHEELYQLQQDPLEKNNLIGQDNYKDIIEQLREQCRDFKIMYENAR